MLPSYVMIRKYHELSVQLIATQHAIVIRQYKLIMKIRTHYELSGLAIIKKMRAL